MTAILPKLGTHKIMDEMQYSAGHVYMCLSFKVR